MDWGKIKTIFIIAFLILDIFLLTQLQVKKEQYEFTNGNTSIEENLKADGIKYGELPKEPVKDHYLSANTMTFTKEDLLDLKDQHIQLEGGKIIHSQLKEPFLVEKSDDHSDLDKFVENNILHGDQYAFWDYNEEEGIITYYQQVDKKFLFMNQSAHLVFHLNSEGEIASYDQTMLDPIKSTGEEEKVLPPIQAIEALYHKGALSNCTIKDVNFGYYTLVNMEATQVLTPTWHILVKKDGVRMDMLVNAYEGTVIQGKPDKEKTILE
ncbi:two-component system regulatory protein YycI [Lederbergia sp. NSJ-179]|uniref:two-component system regulatory protein YycI n=1 Tax=Lederbergia sp. NSJ-179 TaxID=2931402 RepID=UPI001FD5BA2B|nr:two-component system regulatory protein YycI [Lederbergia sp. NSJ-179]MCJ7842865.1 two-component system regulatory protein YycI [Lederbergia sp. NSJ-179]